MKRPPAADQAGPEGERSRVSVWVETQSGVSGAPLLAALRKADVPIAPAGPSRAGAGILLVSRSDEETVSLVSRCSRAGADRVIVVVLGDDLREVGEWELLDAGATDVIPWDEKSVGPVVRARVERWKAVDRLMRSSGVLDDLVGASAPWMALLREVVEIAAFTQANVLVTGETGTGKELVARAIHRLDRRSEKRDLVLLDCTTVVPSLAGSEFFGHEKGSFTGALAPREGAFALANGGTLFLDEVGELPLVLQAELLRVVQEGTYKKVGSNRWLHTRFRLVCATNRELNGRGGDDGFRQDFYHRIAEWRCELPPLRQRRADILPLARHFLAELRPDERLAFHQSVEEFLMSREYPGNVRDLRQLVARIAHRHVGPGPVTLGDIPPAERSAPRPRPRPARPGQLEQTVREALSSGASLRTIQEEATATAIRLALEEADQRVTPAAERLGITPRALQKRLAAQRDRDRENVVRLPEDEVPAVEHPG